MALLLRLFDPDSGAIELDGVDLRRAARRGAAARDRDRAAGERAVRRERAREHPLRGAGRRATPRCARPRASPARTSSSRRCRTATTRELGERGAQLSTGQRQRITIARAILKNAPILVLDEPTASLDAETEHRLVRNLAEWGAGRCVFLVTHRLSTIRMADQIVYLDARQGRRSRHARRADGARAAARTARWSRAERIDARARRERRASPERARRARRSRSSRARCATRRRCAAASR